MTMKNLRDLTPTPRCIVLLVILREGPLPQADTGGNLRSTLPHRRRHQRPQQGRCSVTAHDLSEMTDADLQRCAL